jgi:hypothetical protein
MSKSIQDALDLPVLEDLLRASSNQEGEVEPEITDEMADNHELIENLENNLITPEMADERKERDHESSMDAIHKEAIKHSQDLMDLGYNVDTRSSGRMFETAANMLKIALDAKNSKRDAQMKLQKLKLEERKVDIVERQTKAGAGGAGEVVDGQTTIVEDRNELIKQMRLQQSQKNT